MSQPTSIGSSPKADLDVRLRRIESVADIPQEWRNSPIEELIAAHNFGQPITEVGSPRLCLATCIDFRFAPKVPASFAYVLRRPNGSLTESEVPLAYTIYKGVKHVALVGHDDCGMTKVGEHAPGMVKALVEQGWDQGKAEEFLNAQAGRYAISDEVEALEQEFVRVRGLFKNIVLAPLFVSLSTHKLFIPEWYFKYSNSKAEIGDKVSAKEIEKLSR